MSEPKFDYCSSLDCFHFIFDNSDICWACQEKIRTKKEVDDYILSLKLLIESRWKQKCSAVHTNYRVAMTCVLSCAFLEVICSIASKESKIKSLNQLTPEKDVMWICCNAQGVTSFHKWYEFETYCFKCGSRDIFSENTETFVTDYDLRIKGSDLYKLEMTRIACKLCTRKMDNQ
jgi:hypothetical protein